MKRFARPIITLGLGIILALFSAALMYAVPPVVDGDFSAAAFFVLQPSSTPAPQDLSEIGSTDGIVTMGCVITLIVIVPILLNWKSWRETR